MPANRSRTERWRDGLEQIFERHGGIEISVVSEDDQPDLIWRVRILRLTDDEIVVERPSAMGATFDLSPGTKLVGAMVIGQNRWMFHTEVSGITEFRSRHADTALSLRMPDGVERCRRREFFRISTASLNLPMVECWPVLEPASLVAAELANRHQIEDASETDSTLLPEVGPVFQCNLLNISGGGVGLLVERENFAAVDRVRLFWLRLHLHSGEKPVGVTARLAHTHIDSTQNIYAGFAFEFSHHESHRDFVIERINHCIQDLQRRQAA